MNYFVKHYATDLLYMNTNNNLLSVSYTHLDVYKRQTLIKTTALFNFRQYLKLSIMPNTGNYT